jgi:hypothetical protein
MGIVYEALDRESNARVALKTLKDWSADALLRLKSEFRTLQDLRHRNLVRLGELIEEHGQWFFTMELVQGRDFIAYVRTGVNPSESKDGYNTAETAPIRVPRGEVPRTVGFDEQRLRSGLNQLTQALSVLHAAGKVHRDVKPSNILAQDDGRIVLVDFGLAASVDVDCFTSESSQVLGTALYMAPEQAMAGSVGPEADWYSVGVTLYQALTGTVPFDGPPPEVMLAKQRELPAPPSALVPGVPPDLNALCVDLMRVDPSARPTGAEILRRLDQQRVPAPASSPASFTQAPVFVGRDRELTLLGDAFADVRNHSTAAACIQGVSGVGKTALVRRFVETLLAQENDVVVLAGRCYERESVPYKAFDGIVDALTRYMNRMARPDAVVPRMAGLLAQAFPVLMRVEAIAQAPKLEHKILDPQELRRQIFAAMRELLTRLGDRHPLLLVIDDLQWADADSMALLKEILRPPDAPALLLLATTRTADEPLFRSLPATIRHIVLEPLPPDEARTLAGQLIERFHPAVSVSADAIAREAGGHPLFIDELVRHAHDHRESAGALRLDEALLARIARLDPETRQILELLAVAGTPLTQTTAARAARLSIAAFTTRLLDLRMTNLVRTGGARLQDVVELYHDRVREAILGQLDESQRATWHERLAVSIETSEKPDPEALAFHWQSAGDPEKASNFAVRAAERAADALAFDRAARLYELALRLRPPEGGEGRALRIKLGDALANAGRGKEAAAAYLASIEGGTAADTLDLRRRAAQQLLLTGRIEEGLDTIQSVLATVGLAYPATPRRALAAVLWRRLLLKLRGQRFRRRDESSVPTRDLARIDVCWHAGMTLAVTDHIRGHAFHGQGLLLALRAGEPYRLARALALEIGYRCTPGGPARASVERMLGVIEPLARELDHPHINGFILAVRGQFHFLSGRFSQALELCQQSEDVFRQRCVGAHWEINTMRLWTARSLLYLGRLEELSRRIPAALEECRGRGDLYGDTSLRSSVYPHVCLATDEPARAKEEIAYALKQWSPRGFHVQHYYASSSEVCADLYAGDAVAALDTVDRTWVASKRALLLRVQMVRIGLWDLRARAAIALAQRDPARREELLGRAARDARRVAAEDMPWSNPLAMLLRAGIHAVRREREAAAVELQAAVSGLDQAELALNAAAARRRLGELQGGDEGRARTEEANAWMLGQGVKDPARMTALYAPGFEQ